MRLANEGQWGRTSKHVVQKSRQLGWRRWKRHWTLCLGVRYNSGVIHMHICTHVFRVGGSSWTREWNSPMLLTSTMYVYAFWIWHHRSFLEKRSTTRTAYFPSILSQRRKGKEEKEGIYESTNYPRSSGNPVRRFLS